MFYKQINSGGQLIAVGQTIDNTILSKGFIEISKKEYDAFRLIIENSSFDIIPEEEIEEGEEEDENI